MEFHGLGLGVVERERGYSTASLGVIFLLSPKKGLADVLCPACPWLCFWDCQNSAMLESCSQGMQEAGPNPAPLHQQIAAGSLSIYIQDLVGLVGDVKPIASFLQPCSQSRASWSAGTAAHGATASPS